MQSLSTCFKHRDLRTLNNSNHCLHCSLIPSTQYTLDEARQVLQRNGHTCVIMGLGRGSRKRMSLVGEFAAHVRDVFKGPLARAAL